MTEDERQLLASYRALPAGEQETLRCFAEFLVSRADAGSARAERLGEPVEIARPDEESVVAAMRRLRETYPMLDAADLLHQAAGLLAEHTMQGRSADAVIDELEHLFAAHYERVRSTQD